MNKQDNKLALSVLATLTAGIALIYTLIMFHTIIFAVAGMSVLFLITAFILTQNLIAFSTMKSKSLNVHIKDCVDDISTQLENINGAQSQLGKATYVYTKQAAQAVSTLEHNYTESQEALYKNLASLSNAQNKATKLMIKYDQNNTTKLLAGIKDMRNKLSETMIQGFDQIQPNNADVVAALEEIVTYLKTLPTNNVDQTLGLQLNNVAHELQNISNSIQHVQVTPVQTTTPVNTVPMMQNPSVPVQVAEKPIIEEIISTPTEEESKLDALLNDVEVNNTEINDEEVNDTVANEDITNEPEVAITVEAALNEEVIPEPETEVVKSKEIASTIEDIADEINEKLEMPEMVEAFEEVKKAPTIADISDDPNKQLSADVIAALFAASEPTPKKAVTEEETFTPTFTVVGKSNVEDNISETKEPVISEDPNKQLSADEIAALFAAADPAPKQETKVEEVIAKVEEPVKIEPVSDDPNKQLSADEIAALFAAADPTPKKEESVAKAPEPVKVEPISEDPNKQLSADEIAALFASIG